jgi:hypothetical protein
MRTKVTLILVFLNVALFFFIFKFERSWRTERASLEARRRVLGTEAADIRSLVVTSTVPGGSYTLARRGEVWWLTAPMEWPANPHAVNSLKTELQLLEHVSSFNVSDLEKNNQHLADYGLEKPRLTVQLISGEGPGATSATLSLGDVTKDGTRLYVLSPDGKRIHVVNRTVADSLALPLESLRADSLLTIPVSEARALSVQTSGVRVRIRREGARWLFDTIIDARANKTTLEDAIGGLNGLHPKTFNPPNPPATLPSAAPTLRVTLEGNNRSETLFLGEPLGPTAITTGAATAPDIEYYAQLDRRPALFTVAVPAALLDALRNAPLVLREKRILEFDPHAVTAITLAQPILPNQPPLTLQRLEAPAGSAPDAPASWQIVRRGATTPGPQTLPADRARVQRLLDQLALLAAKNFQTDASTNADLENWGFKRPEREVTLTLGGPPTPPATPAGGPLVLSLGTDTQRAVYALVGPTNPGSSIYAVDRAILDDELPVEIRAWRDRQLFDLPAVARLTELKLTDLNGNQVLLEVSLDANGHAPAPTPNHPAVETILTALHHLRAKSFPQDTFTEQVLVGGDERPWRYQLDYTLALPGGAGGEQTSVKTLLFTERVGGDQQLGGSKELDAVFEIEQPFLDALWTIIYRDPGPPAAEPAPKQ